MARETHTPDPDSIPVLAMAVGTTNDTNGNPRRGWAIYDTDGWLVAFVDHAYRGLPAVRKPYGWLPVTGEITITPGQYRELRKFDTPQGYRHPTWRPNPTPKAGE